MNTHSTQLTKSFSARLWCCKKKNSFSDLTKIRNNQGAETNKVPYWHILQNWMLRVNASSFCRFSNPSGRHLRSNEVQWTTIVTVSLVIDPRFNEPFWKKDDLLTLEWTLFVHTLKLVFFISQKSAPPEASGKVQPEGIISRMLLYFLRYWTEKHKQGVVCRVVVGAECNCALNLRPFPSILEFVLGG